MIGLNGGMLMDPHFVYTGHEWPHNWLYNQFFLNGHNLRYYTFQLALNLLHQTKRSPVIIETGCQRYEKELGDGYSTTLFCEYITRYGGKLISIDINPNNVNNAINWTAGYSINKEFIISDSVAFLKQYNGPVDLIYFDSWDYPLDNEPDIDLRRYQSQQHNLNELKAVEQRLSSCSIILLDDNQLPGGGKPKLTKDYLVKKGYICLLDLQQSIWIKQLKRRMDYFE
jgi:hypothetical protein